MLRALLMVCGIIMLLVALERDYLKYEIKYMY